MRSIIVEKMLNRAGLCEPGRDEVAFADRRVRALHRFWNLGILAKRSTPLRGDRAHRARLGWHLMRNQTHGQSDFVQTDTINRYHQL